MCSTCSSTFLRTIVFRPFRNSTSKAWKALKRPLSVTLAYVVVALVVVFITCFIIPGLIESMSLLADNGHSRRRRCTTTTPCGGLTQFRPRKTT